MPLQTGTSKAAFHHNVLAELRAMKPIKQAVAIAYAQQRKDGEQMNDALTLVRQIAAGNVRADADKWITVHPNEPLTLTGQSNAEIIEAERNAAEVVKARIAEDNAERKAKQERDADDILKRIQAMTGNADNFIFGESSKEAAKPMGNLFAHDGQIIAMNEALEIARIMAGTVTPIA